MNSLRPVEFEAIGWAVIENDKIKLRTVSDTRRASIVQFLIMDRNRLIYNSMTDDEIERLWSDLRGSATVEYVTITRLTTKTEVSAT